MIVLPIKKKWFDMILSGEKKEEYRSITKRYQTMFKNAVDSENVCWCVLRNGYSSSSPCAIIRVKVSVGFGKTEWGAEPNQQYFVLSILEIK